MAEAFLNCSTQVVSLPRETVPVFVDQGSYKQWPANGVPTSDLG